MLKHIFICSIMSVGQLPAGTNLAVLDFTGEEIAEKHLLSLADVLRSELIHFDTLSVMEREDMSAVLANNGVEQLKCSAYDCAVVAGLLLDVDLLVTVDVTKIGEVYLVQGRLYDPEEGRVLNTVTYDHELTLEGLLSRGMKNVALMLISRRIPFPAHKMKELVYIQSIPTGAKVMVGKEEMEGVTPLALDRVIVESQRITVIKEKYEKYVINSLPKDDSRVFFVKLNPLDPAAFQGNLAFAEPMPGGIYILSEDGETSLLVPEGATELNALQMGRYNLNSDQFIIQNGIFNIKPRKTTRIKPIFIQRALLEKKLKWHRIKRNMLFTSAILTMGYRVYLENTADEQYQKYLGDPQQPTSLRASVEQEDKLKPILVGSSVSFLVPAIYQQAMIFKTKKILAGRE